MPDKQPSSYIAKPVDDNGYVDYTAEENNTWKTLITRQLPIVEEYGCEEYLHGLTLLDLPKDKVPQCPEISHILQEMTGWALEPVPALIPAEHFFHLLANRKFPAATFIRRQEEIDYLKEPDIFHEMFGHCPLLTNQGYANFAQTYGQLALKANDEERILLAKLYWFTIEFGLIKKPDGLRVYGGGILSSMKETVYSVDSDKPLRKPFDVVEIVRTPYRIDIMQPIYFVIDNFDTLFHLTEMDLMSIIRKASTLEMYKPIY